MKHLEYQYTIEHYNDEDLEVIVIDKMERPFDKNLLDKGYLTQSELAKKSGVSLRSIQMYEQRKNDIDKAQGHTLYKLSVALGCDMGDLLERPNKDL